MSIQGGFQKRRASDIQFASVIWGSHQTGLPLPNLYMLGSRSFLHPIDPTHTDEDIAPYGGFDITGTIKGVSFRRAASFNDREKSTNENNLLRMSLVLTSTDDQDYGLIFDLGDTAINQYNSNSLGVLGVLAEIATIGQSSEELKGFENHIFQFSFYQSKKQEDGRVYSRATVRNPVAYRSETRYNPNTSEHEEISIPEYASDVFIKTELPPRPEKVNTPDYGEVIKTVHIKNWMEGKIETVQAIFGQQQQQAQTQAQDQQNTDGGNQDQEMADSLDTTGISSDLGSPSP